MFFPSYRESFEIRCSEEAIDRIKRIKITLAGTSYTALCEQNNDKVTFIPKSDLALFHNSFAPVAFLTIIRSLSKDNALIEIESCLRKSVQVMMAVLCSLPVLILLCALIFQRFRKVFLLFFLFSLGFAIVFFAMPHIGFYFANHSFVTQLKAALKESGNKNIENTGDGSLC